MPTLRKFFKHFMPRLMGTSLTASRSYGPSHAIQQSEARSRKRRQYAQFPEEDDVDNELQVFSDDHVENGNESAASTSPIADARSSAGDTDNHSEKGIVQTKSFAIRYD